MLSKLTLRNAAGEDIVLHEDTSAARRLVKSATGLVGVTGLRQSKRVRPQAHGSINETSYQEGSLIAIDGEVWSVAASGQIEAALEELRAIDQVCLETLPTPGFPAYGPALLKWTEGTSGLKLQKLVKLDSDLDPTLQEAAGFIPYHVQFFSEDPRAYSQTLTEATGADLSLSAVESSWLKAGSPPPFASGIAVDGTYIYYPNGAYIGRAKLNGSSPEPTWVKTTVEQVRQVRVNGSNIFWSSNTEYIGRATLAGGSIENTWLATATAKVNGLAITSEHVYWRASKKYIGRATLAGGSIEPNWISGLPQAQGYGLAANSEHIYWGENNSIARAAIGGGAIEPEWIANLGVVAGIALDATYGYWANEPANTLGRVKLTGAEVTQSFVLLEGASPTAIAVNSEHVYWYSAATGYIGRDAIGGQVPGSSITVAQSGNRPTPMTFKIHGPITNPSIVRTSDGSRIALTGEIASGNYIEINTAERTVKLNGLASDLSMLNAQGTNWPAFEAPPNPKTVEYELTGTTATAAYMEAIYRSAYA